MIDGAYNKWEYGQFSGDPVEESINSSSLSAQASRDTVNAPIPTISPHGRYMPQKMSKEQEALLDQQIKSATQQIR